MVAISAGLAAVLIVRGNVLVGGLIAALAVARVLTLVAVRRRRAEMAGRFPRRFNR
jgi:hypothetical protein